MGWRRVSLALGRPRQELPGKLREESPVPERCPSCGALNPPDWNSCSLCYARFVKCRNCHADSTEGQRCPRCGVLNKIEPQTPALQTADSRRCCNCHVNTSKGEEFPGAGFLCLPCVR